MYNLPHVPCTGSYSVQFRQHAHTVVSKCAERQASEVILEYINAELVKFNVYHETGFELDVFHAKLNLNIELDGPHHRGRLARDSRRDEILARYGVEVVRVSVVEKSYAEVAADALRLLGPTSSDKGDAAEAKNQPPAKKSKAAGAEEEDLAALSRRELQARARAAGVPVNLKSVEIIRRIQEQQSSAREADE